MNILHVSAQSILAHKFGRALVTFKEDKLMHFPVMLLKKRKGYKTFYIPSNCYFFFYSVLNVHIKLRHDFFFNSIFKKIE